MSHGVENCFPRLWVTGILGAILIRFLFVLVCITLGHLYTGTLDGKIIHIENNQIETVAELGTPPCGN